MVELAPVRHLLVALLVVTGTFFLTVGTIGLLRFPNVYNRMHATSKPTTLGTISIFLAGFVEFGPGGAGLTSLVGILFLFLTVPTGAHMISRAAQKTGIPFLPGVTWPEFPDTREIEEFQEMAYAGDAGQSLSGSDDGASGDAETGTTGDNTGGTDKDGTDDESKDTS